jgi:protein phosphatase
MKIQVSTRTDVGKVRSLNEDSFGSLPEKAFFVLADGMGGHAHGEVASSTAVETMTELYQQAPEPDLSIWEAAIKAPLEFMALAIQKANAMIREKAAADLSYKSMGTTIVAMHFLGDKAVVGQVGDSRIYRLRDGELSQIGEDHSLLNEYIKLGIVKKSQAATFPLKNIILRALGLADKLEADVYFTEVRPGDKYLLCSDGLTDMVEEARIAQILGVEGDPDPASTLVDEALLEGGNDNVTVMILAIPR